jgi:glycosyltransferase involved in cell wall biosynthesis
MSDPFERPPIAQSPLSVVLPAYNAETCVQKVLGKWKDQLESLARESELFLVDDGSTDHTAELAADVGAKWPRFQLLRHPAPQGIGAALRTGLAAARLPLFCYAECSTAYQPAELGRLLEVIDKVDLVSGQRVWPARRQPSAWRQYAYRGLLRFLYGLRLKDVDCAFKMFRRSIFARIPIQSNSSFVHAEILAKANFLGCIMTEAPVHYQPSRGPDAPSLPVATWRVEASRVFFRPDFGPAVLPNAEHPGASHRQNAPTELF